jgi:thioredoxin-dependent peroxiredoxin
MSLTIGNKCPDFKLQDQNGQWVDIKTLIGAKNLIIYFYPKDDTPGCTKEACMFRDSYEEFKDLGCEVIGISSDDIKSHKAFSEKHRLSFLLLADVKGTVRKQFGVPGNLFGLIPGRVTYIVDKKGTIQGVFNSLLDPAGHLKSAFETVKKL